MSHVNPLVLNCFYVIVIQLYKMKNQLATAHSRDSHTTKESF